MITIRTFCAAIVGALALTVSAPASAQNTELYGAYCGAVTWSGGAPIDTWIIFLRGERWSSSLSVGAFTDASEGTRQQNGASLTMNSNDAPHYVMQTTVGDGRIDGTVTNDRGQQGVIRFRQMRGTGAGLASSPIPPDFEINSARSALAGNWDDVQRAMTWAWTAQGSDYWRSLHASGPPLPPVAASALADWIRREEAGERPTCEFD